MQIISPVSVHVNDAGGGGACCCCLDLFTFLVLLLENDTSDLTSFHVDFIVNSKESISTYLV